MGPLLGPPAPPSFEPLVTALINDLVDRPDGEEVLLVLDDYHLIDSEPVHATVDFLLDHRPETCGWSWLAAPIRRWRWPGCGPAASWPTSGPPICGSPTVKRPTC